MKANFATGEWGECPTGLGASARLFLSVLSTTRTGALHFILYFLRSMRSMLYAICSTSTLYALRPTLYTLHSALYALGSRI
jgi:hypothetical protein